MGPTRSQTRAAGLLGGCLGRCWGELPTGEQGGGGGGQTRAAAPDGTDNNSPGGACRRHPAAASALRRAASARPPCTPQSLRGLFGSGRTLAVRIAATIGRTFVAPPNLQPCCYPSGRAPFAPPGCVEVGGVCCNPTGRGLRLPSLRQVMCAELELDCVCRCPPVDAVYALPCAVTVRAGEPTRVGGCGMQASECRGPTGGHWQ